MCDISLNVMKYSFAGLIAMTVASKVQIQLGIWGYGGYSVFLAQAEKPPNTAKRIKSHARRIHPSSSLLFVSLLSIFLFQVSASGRGERGREKERKKVRERER